MWVTRWCSDLKGLRWLHSHACCSAGMSGRLWKVLEGWSPLSHLPSPGTLSGSLCVVPSAGKTDFHPAAQGSRRWEVGAAGPCWSLMGSLPCTIGQGSYRAGWIQGRGTDLSEREDRQGVVTLCRLLQSETLLSLPDICVPSPCHHA